MLKIFTFISCQTKNVLKQQLFRKTLWLTLSKIGSLIIQMGYFIIIARVLGPEQFGLFVGVTAMASLIFGFATFGSGDILIKHTARDFEQFRKYWGNALYVSFVASTLLIVVCLFAVKIVFLDKFSLLEVFLILLSDLLGLAVFDVSTKAFLAVDFTHRVAHVQLFYGFTKLVAALIFFLGFFQYGLAAWAWLYCASTIITALVALWLVNRTIAPPKFTYRLPMDNFREGFHFAVGYSADTVNEDIDKTMLVSMATLGDAGAYAAGNRFLTAAFMPVLSLFNTTYMRFFKHGAEGITGGFNFARHLLPPICGYGVLATVGFLIFAPFVPYLLGPDYIEVVGVLRWLSPYILIISVQTLAADILTGSGFQWIRSAANIFSAILNFGLNFWLIPLFSWRGAAWATLTSDGLKTIVLWIVVVAFYQKQIKQQNT